MAAVGVSMLLVGIAVTVNLGASVENKKTLQGVADAAALQAEKTVRAAQASSSTAMSQADIASMAQQTVENYVKANTPASSTAPDISVTYTSLSTYSGNVSVTLSKKTSSFMSGFLRSAGTAVSVTSTATMTLGNSYIQIIFLVDISNSMGIGGTPADISALENSSAQCAFACHDPNGYRGSCVKGSSSSWNSWLPPCNTRVTAKNAGINLKIDYVNQAVQDFMAQLIDYSNIDQNHITASITTYGTTIQQIQAPTTDLNAVNSVASTIDLENAVALPVLGYTRTGDALNSIASQLTNVGQGESENSQRTYVIFISDGAQDIYSNANGYQHIVTVAYQSACTNLKQMGVTLLSVWVPYYPIYGSQQYDTVIAPLPTTGPGSMQGAMQACATSSDYYFEADDGPTIKSALASSLSSIITSSGLRLIK
ncbi:MAG: vWA domain-containing protein [Acetobacter aceti]|uniref:VWFA domain-containing protein n=1 Tax=Acetobacter aceti TaxID=435 RepID=A0A1U9KK05_ACEAC|nr:vWA domain-containing protein [Acetobacter aceti]AQS86078.1 hypothetical protein A0U92_16465 [Acetobacter aceti]